MGGVAIGLDDGVGCGEICVVGQLVATVEAVTSDTIQELVYRPTLHV
jgi:hypothetical protein